MKQEAVETMSIAKEASVASDAKVSSNSNAKQERESISKSLSSIKAESRDEDDSSSRKNDTNERDGASSDHQTSKRSQTKTSSSRKNTTSSTTSPRPSPQRHYSGMHDGGYPSYHQMPMGRGPYHPPHAMHSGPRGPAPAPSSFPPPGAHYYGAGPHDHFRGHPPPPHYHGMPPIPHPGQPGHYGGQPGHYAPPPNMSGRPGPPPPGYHPAPYGAPYPPPHMGYHGAPPPTFSHQGNHPNTMTSDSTSISSSKSKGGSDRRSTKVKASSGDSRKKRTIDGIHQSSNKDKVPLAYTFRRTNSNASTSSTVTANNATDTHPLCEESPHKRERTSSRSSSHLPPLSHSSSNIFEEGEKFHRRHLSGASSSSSLSVGGFSLSSYDAHRQASENPLIKSSPKRRRGEDSEALAVDTGANRKSIFKRKSRHHPSDSSIDGPTSSHFQQLSMTDSKDEKSNNNLFLSLSTSPINNPEVDATPLSKNTNKKSTTKGKITIKTDLDDDDTNMEKTSPVRKPVHDRPVETPTPPMPAGLSDSDMMTDEQMLNRHLRGQSFTPLAQLSEAGVSPTNLAFAAIGPQLSWSIAGDTPSLEDLATCSWEETDKDDKKRPGSTTSQLSNSSRNIVISPHSFTLWKEEHESGHIGKKGEEGKDNETVRLSMLSPHSEIAAMAVDGEGGTTTPLPLCFEQPSSEERENVHRPMKQNGNDKKLRSQKHGEPEHIHHMFVSNGGRGLTNKHHQNGHWHGRPQSRESLPPTPVYGSKPPTPLYGNSNVGFARSPLHGDRNDFFKPPMFGQMPPGAHNDRVRNLRGRVPPGAHLAPMPLHIPPPMSSHHPLTSPMGIGHAKAPMWSPHHGSMHPPMASPHHMSPMDMSQSKRKCVPLKPPIPSKFQGDMEKMKTAPVPEFTSLVNFPAHMSQKQSVNLPEGMRCCVMCGQACPCSTGSKKKGGTLTNASAKANNAAPRNGQDHLSSDKNGGYAIIPTQNKGLCTLCDVNVWVVTNSGLEIKWCKGCKNFRPWAAFGDKGLATKCLRCRERQREKYALQKEEKERARMKGTKAKG